MAPNPFETLPENLLLCIFGPKIREKKVGIWAPGPPRRDPGRNSVPDPGFKVPNGGMATHLVAKRCDLGSPRFQGPASTPGWGTDLQSTLKRPGKIYHWNLTVPAAMTSAEFSPRMPSLESGPRLSSEKSGLVAAAAAALALRGVAPNAPHLLLAR